MLLHLSLIHIFAFLNQYKIREDGTFPDFDSYIANFDTLNKEFKMCIRDSPIALNNVENSEYVKNQQPTATLKHTVEGCPILLIMNFHTT